MPLNALRLFHQYQGQLARENSSASLFAQPPTLSFGPTQRFCPHCQAPLQVYKTRRRTLHTLPLGGFTARETLRHCGQCPHPTIYAAEELDQLAPAGGTFGYDVMVFVGQGLFRRQRRAQEIVEELRARHVRISRSEVGYLARKFVVYLALAHRQSAPDLQAALRAQGGYILHLDGTCEGGGPMLMSSLDSLSEIVLGNVKVPSEKTEQLVPFLEQIKARYGVPLAAVHDMGAGILAAIRQVFGDLPDFICHFHFLRDLGKDLLGADYEAIRQRLRRHGLTERLRYQARHLKRRLDAQPGWVERFCRSVGAVGLPSDGLERFPAACAYSLIQWALAGKTSGEGYGFPFDRPQVEFAKRLLVLAQKLEPIKPLHLRGQWADNKPLFKLSCALEKLAADAGLQRLLRTIDLKIEVFDRLRRALRIAEVGGGAGLNSGDDPVALGPIQKAVEQFRRDLLARSDYPTTAPWQALVAQLDKYKDKLFADPIAVATPGGARLIQPQRTNNLMERFFRDFRRSARRRSGHHSLNRFLQSMIADTPLVRNLENPRYLEILLGGQPTLEARFAQIHTETVRAELEAAQKSLENVPAKIHRLIAAPTFPETISQLFQKAL